VAEGTSLLRKHTGLNLYREFESHHLRQYCEKAPYERGFFYFRTHSSTHVVIALAINEATLERLAHDEFELH
jgi:hypothetical protein